MHLSNPPKLTRTVTMNSHLSLLLLLAIAGAVITAGQQPELADCPGRCGNISIPFPFGMKPGCFLPGFEVICNTTFDPPRAFFKLYNGSEANILQEEGYRLNGDGKIHDYSNVPLELMDISASKSEARVYLAVTSLCFTSLNSSNMTFQSTYLRGPFLPSTSRNALLGIGYHIAASLGESLFFPISSYKISCSGLNFCQASLSGAGVSQLSWFGARLDVSEDFNTEWETSPCYYAMVVDRSWYNFSMDDTHGYEPNGFSRGVPIVVDFAIRNNASSCPGKGQQPPPGYACVSGNSSCANATNGEGYVCKCWDNYDGNPYISNGCQDINECELPELYPCSNGICKNRLGGYDCPCKYGMKGDGKKGTCTDIFPLPAKIVVGAVVGIFFVVVAILLAQISLHKRKLEILFKKNQLTIYTKRDLKKYTNNFSKPLGKGEFGTVYEGTLPPDTQQGEGHSATMGFPEVVAVKVSNNTTPMANNVTSIKQEFIHEVEIQGKMIHKNILRLLGCCLEAKKPMLVYRFAAKGSLHDFLHKEGTRELSIPLTDRLDIAIGAAAGLKYMHMGIDDGPIRHGDVKPGNILLDDKLTPKISDFGLSKLLLRSKFVEDGVVVGANGYMDPAYLCGEDKSVQNDVYSFGVVLLELITRKTLQLYVREGQEIRSLLVDEYHKVFEKEKTGRAMFDNDITKPEGNIFILEKIGKLALKCMKDIRKKKCMKDDANDRRRPDMKYVLRKLEKLRNRMTSGKGQDTSPHHFEDINADDFPSNNTDITSARSAVPLLPKKKNK